MSARRENMELRPLLQHDFLKLPGKLSVLNESWMSSGYESGESGSSSSSPYTSPSSSDSPYPPLGMAQHPSPPSLPHPPTSPLSEFASEPSCFRPRYLHPQDQDSTSSRAMTSGRDDVTGIRETMTYTNMEDLCNCLTYVISMPDLCDVTFLVGPDQVPVHGVKAILASRSRVMFELLLRQQKQTAANGSKKSKASRGDVKLQVPLPDVSPQPFAKLLTYLHCGKIKVHLDDVIDILSLATHFLLTDLRIACWDLVDRSLQRGHSHFLLTCAENRADPKVQQELAKRIQQLNEKPT